MPAKDHTKDRLRLCVTCRKSKPYPELIRLTASHSDGQVSLTHAPWAAEIANNTIASGRSAYICAQTSCIEPLLKGTRLKMALAGRKRKDVENRLLQWPLEPQLIQLLASKCTEPAKTCQNKQNKEITE